MKLPLVIVIGATTPFTSGVVQASDDPLVPALEIELANPQFGDFFGAASVLEGSLALVGAPGQDVDGTGNTGAIYVFDAATGEQLREIVSDVQVASQGLGTALAIDDGVVAAGAPSRSASRGGVYVFDVATGEQLSLLVPNDVTTHSFNGRSVAISDVYIASGGYRANSAPPGEFARGGAVYLFDRSSGQQVAKYAAPDFVESQRFGWSVGLTGDGSTLFVGAPYDEQDGPFSGAVYVFDTTTQQLVTKLFPDEPVEGALFGSTLAIADGYLVVGASRQIAQEDVPRVHVFDLATLTEQHVFGGGNLNRGWYPHVATAGDLVVCSGLSTVTGIIPIYNMDTGKQVACLSGSGEAESIAISTRFVVMGDETRPAGSAVSAGGADIYNVTSLFCPTDLNFDGEIDLADLNVVLSAFGLSDNPQADVNDDGEVNLADLNAILAEFGSGCGAP